MKLSQTRVGVLAVLTVCLFCVVILARPRGARTLKGIYQTGPEQSAFFVDGDCSKRPFWFTWPDQLDKDSEKRLWSVGRPEALRLKVRASVSPEGKYGHLQGYPREVQVLEVISVDAATPCPWPGERRK